MVAAASAVTATVILVLRVMMFVLGWGKLGDNEGLNEETTTMWLCRRTEGSRSSGREEREMSPCDEEEEGEGRGKHRRRGFSRKRSLLFAKPSLSSEPGVIERQARVRFATRRMTQPPPSSHRARSRAGNCGFSLHDVFQSSVLVAHDARFCQFTGSETSLAETPDYVRGEGSLAALACFLACLQSPFRLGGDVDAGRQQCRDSLLS